MKMYLKQQVLTIPEKFYVKDKDGKNIYTVKREIWSFGKKFHIYNTNSDEICFLKQKVWSLMSRYDVLINGKKETEIKRVFNFLKPKYVVNGKDREISGDFWAHNYLITQNDTIIAKIRKHWLSFWGDSYELDIQESQNELLTLAVVLAIDADLLSHSDHG